MTQDSVSDLLRQLLNEAADSIDQGGDTSPSLRFKIEAEIARLVASEPDLFDSLARDINNRIPRAALNMLRTAPHLEICRERPPVVPATKNGPFLLLSRKSPRQHTLQFFPRILISFCVICERHIELLTGRGCVWIGEAVFGAGVI